MFRHPIAFLVYFVSATAEVSRIPFDLPEGESELVAGFHTEYSSMKFALIQMAEYVNLISVAVLATHLKRPGLDPDPDCLPRDCVDDARQVRRAQRPVPG